MTDWSECESDAGASPSVSSSEDSTNSSSSRESSPAALKIVSGDTPQHSTPKRKRANSNSNSSAVANSSTDASLSTTCGILSPPTTTERKSPRRRVQMSTLPVFVTPQKTAPRTSSQNETDASNKSSSSLPRRKRKRSSNSKPCPTTTQVHIAECANIDIQPSPLTPSTPESKGKNKRRRTRSERNILAGKTSTPTGKGQQVVTEGEEAVALDAEIDRVLEEKAIKNNLSATNVKSIIHHVITNNLVQKMIMSAMKKKADVHDRGSSDEDGLLEPKMTRAKTKELMSNKIPLWPIVESPVKLGKQTVSETHMLIQHDLPEDSSGDEEYVPKEAEIHEMTHVTSDDESGSAVSFASDTGSPASQKLGVSTRRRQQLSENSPFKDPLFKTPPPRPRNEKSQVESAISRRTRSKLPLNDTPLEDLERQLVAPDITKDMYDWGTETDNEDYLAFLKDFLNPGRVNDSIEHDDEADPEYNVMEDVEDIHDREELRMDRAVKVPKKELTQLIAELFESGVLSGDDDDHDLASLTGITPLNGNAGDLPLVDTRLDTSASVQNSTFNDSADTSIKSTAARSLSTTPAITVDTSVSKDVGDSVSVPQTNFVTQVFVTEVADGLTGTNPVSVITMKVESEPTIDTPVGPTSSIKTATTSSSTGEPPLFRECDIQFLQQQMRQHIQLLSQTYVLTASTEDVGLKRVSKLAKGMIIGLKNFARVNGDTSNFAVCNLDPAWNLVNYWPHKFLQQSPMKKRILEEKYISESSVDTNDAMMFFPRHVVKVIAENPAFLYNNLLPECYCQKNFQSKVSFSYWEDALLVSALDDCRESKQSTSQLSELISRFLLVAHPPTQIYHRIRNLRKKSPNAKTCDPAILKYFADGTLPLPDRTVTEITQLSMEPLLQRDRANVTSHWNTLLQTVEDSSTSSFKWMERLKHDPVTKSVAQKWSRKGTRQQKTLGKAASKKTRSGKPNESEVISRVFPNGTLAVESKPGMEAIPLLGADGRPGAVIYIPKYALPGADTQNVRPLRVVAPMSRDESGKEQPGVVTMNNCQPRVAEEAEMYGHQNSSTSTLNMLELQHLVRASKKSPAKNYPASPERTQIIPTGRGYSVVQPVGKNPTQVETIESIPPDKPVSVMLSMPTLQTPAKIEEADSSTHDQIEEVEGEEATKTNEVGADPDELHDDASDASSCNVIEEGTEVELSDDYLESDGENNSEKSPEVVTLSDDEYMIQIEEREEEKPLLVAVDGGDGKGGKSDNNSSKGETSTSTNNSKGSNNAGASTSLPSTSVSTAKKSSGAGAGDSDEDGERRNNRKRSLPKACKDDIVVKDEDVSNKSGEKPTKASNQSQSPSKRPPQSHSLATPSSSTSMPAPPNPTTPQHQASSSTSRSQKKARKSPGNQGSSRRASKHSVASTEKMLQEDTNDFEDVADAYMEAYLVKVQSTTEAKNPGIYTTFIQLLMEIDAAEANAKQHELHAKVKVLFKDFPELLREFESFLSPTQSVIDDPGGTAASSMHEYTVAQITFMQQLEKFTENCPHLKAKVMNKVKVLKESGCVTEKEMATALEPFFVHNPVIMDSFKALFPSIYRPQSMSSGMDFEEIELDLEDPPRDNNDDMHFEVVKLPEEKNILATSTCPCVCHAKTSDPAFSNRSKHCRKCSLKFQGGKIFYHNGRVMRPVSVELTPAPKKSTAPSTSTSHFPN